MLVVIKSRIQDDIYKIRCIKLNDVSTVKLGKDKLKNFHLLLLSIDC
jgi:hypothetical protein